MTPARATTRAASPGDARRYLINAAEYLRAAQDSMDLDNRVAATGNAVSAGIMAADAIAAARAGQVWKGEHAQAAQHVEKVGGPDGKKAAVQLRRLLPMKNRAQYDPDPIGTGDAKRALEAARAIVQIAERAIEGVAGT